MGKDWMRNGWLALALLGATLLAWQGTITPSPAPATPGETFSAQAALRDIAVIAREPHPIGSPANAQVRDYLLGRMTQLGLSPAIQETDALSASPDYPQYLAGAHVQNLIGVLPGTDRTLPALVLMSHYDSVPGSPGAADDATGVAATLEVIRAIKAGRTRPVRDIVVLITDGEEWGLSGAEAFFGQHPLAKRTGLIINMEARGGGGRANMFETGRDNGELIARYRKTAKGPISSALAVFLYEKMPNDTDFSVPKRMGLTGLNFAFIGRQFDYHSPTSTVANLDPGSVQSMGEQVLSAADEFAFSRTLPGKAPSAVYSQTFGDHILAYPPIMGWLVLAFAGGMLILAGRRAKRAGEPLRWQDGLKGAGMALTTLLTAALILNLARRGTMVGFGFMEQRPLLAGWPLWEAAIFALGLGVTLILPRLAAATVPRRWPLLAGPILLGGLCSLAGGFDPVGLGLGVAAGILAIVAFGRPVPRNAAWAGVLCLGFVLATALQVFAPQIAFLVAWPLALGSVGAAASRWSEDRRWTPLLALIAALLCGWLGVYVHLTAQGLDFPALLGLFSLLALLVLWPLAQPDDLNARGQAWPVAILALVMVGGVGLTAAVVSNPWSERYPRAYSVMHVTDSHAGKAWLTFLNDDPASRPFRDIASKDVVKASLPPLYDQPAFMTPTPTVPVAAPTLTSRIEPDGRVTIILTPPPGARLARLNIKLSAAVNEVMVQGRKANWLTKVGEVQHLRWAGAGAPLVISFRPVKPDAGLAEIDYGTVLEVWPKDARPLPGPIIPLMPWNLSGSTGVTGKAIVRW